MVSTQMSQKETNKFISNGNVRKVDKRKSEYKALRDNIKSKGIRTPITYYLDVKGNYVIVNGHQRVAIAKDLKINEIPAYEVTERDDVTEEQISVNMFRVPMTIFDASTAIAKIMAKEPDVTRKELQLRFGKNAEWIQKAITLTNLIPELRKYMEENPPESEWYDFILVIAKTPLSKQLEVLTEMYDDESMILNNNKDITEFVEYYNDEMDFYEDFEGKVTSSPFKWDVIKSIIGEKKFRQYEAEKGIEHSYAHSIFSEYAKDQWHQDPQFLADIFIKETDVGHFLKDLHIDFNMQGWGQNVCRLQATSWNSKSKFYSAMKAESGEPFSNVELVEWDGSVFHPHVKFHIIEKTVKTIDKNGNPVETVVSENYDLFKNSYNKINKWLLPIVEDMFFWMKERNSCTVQLDPHINIFKKDDNGMNITIKWLIQETSVNPRFSVPWFYDADDKDNKSYHPLYNFTTKGEKPLDNDMLMQHMAIYWFDKHFFDVTYEELHKLLNALGSPSIDDVLTSNYAVNDEFRSSYLNLMPLKALATLLSSPPKNKQDAIVEILSFSVHKMPFMDKLYTVSGQSSQGFLKEYKPKDTPSVVTS